VKFKDWLQLESISNVWYHATESDRAEKILSQGWSLSFPVEEKLDAGDLGWGIYFWKNKGLLGTYGNTLLQVKIDTSKVLDIADESDPRVQFFHKLLLYDAGGDRLATRTIDPWAKERQQSKSIKDKMVDKLQSRGLEFGDAFQKAINYYPRLTRNRDEHLNFKNAKMIRRNMLKIGVKGVYSGGEVAVYAAEIIQDTKISS